MKKILITGGAGKIGAHFVLNHETEYDITVVDLNTSHIDFPENVRVIEADLSNYKTCKELAKDMDLVIHLAGIIDETENDEALDINSLLIKNVFKATAANKCDRLIFASSAQTIEHYPNDLQINKNRPVRPHNLYGVAKCLGEALASYYADQYGISAICLRIGAYEFPEDHTEMNTRDLSAYLHPDDCNQLLVGCIETKGLHYEILNAISNNRYKRLDISETIEKVGYRPKADAFELFKWKSE
jgi:nucleoside-diphosphate-sugar epimerase